MAADRFLACIVYFRLALCIFPVNCGDQVDRAAEGPVSPSGGSARCLVPGGLRKWGRHMSGHATKEAVSVEL